MADTWTIRYTEVNLDIICTYEIKAHLDFVEDDLVIVVEDIPKFEKAIEDIRAFDINAWAKREL